MSHKAMHAIRIFEKLNRALMVLAAFWAFVLAINISLDVIGRGMFNQPLTGTHEIIRNSIAMITFLQVAYAVQSKSMLRADFLLHLFPDRLNRVLNSLGYLTGAVIFGLVVYGCFDPLMTAIERNEYEGDGALRVPVWPTYIVIILGSTLASL
ncbi:MAG: TRAP transporter small permease, partial [Rhodospirillales bacterium]|nr:TRAP transporter small permease [Rhodospirillales bacterium]